MADLTRETVQALDSGITKIFLKKNYEIIEKIISHFVINMNSFSYINDDCNFYLKGGNSISLLDNKPLTGDFDFQLLPKDYLYNNWNENFLKIDHIIINSMLNAIIELSKDINYKNFDIESFNVVNFSNYDGVKPEEIYGLKLKKRKNDVTFNGKIYGIYSYDNIIMSPLYDQKTQRIKFKISEKNSFQSEKEKQCGPCIYVNYAIPGFILYRLVYCYKYEKIDSHGRNTTFYLKSEIIDVSVPRPKSPEIYISQEGVTTFFREIKFTKDCMIKVPGWGYHFYENLTMLQEIALDISLSGQKISKRIQRLKYAMDKLQIVNFESMKKPYFLEPFDETSNSKKYICGYLFALINGIMAYKQIISSNTYQYILNAEYNNALRDFDAFTKTQLELIDYLVNFKIRKKDKTALTVEIIKKFILLNFKDKYFYKILMPIEELDNEFPLPYYLLFFNTNEVYLKILNLKKYKKSYKVQKNEYVYDLYLAEQLDPSLLFVFNTISNIYLRNFKITDLLKYTILESQRYPITLSVFKMKNTEENSIKADSNEQEQNIIQGSKLCSFVATIPELYEQLKVKKSKCMLTDVFPDLPDYFDEQDTRINNSVQEDAQHHFLSELVLYNLELPDGPTENTILFRAEIMSPPQFLTGSPCYDSVKGRRTLECCITEISENEFLFTGSYCDLSNCDITFSALQLSVTKLSFSSGTTSNAFLTPRFMYDCKLTDNTILATVQQAGTNQFEISGNYQRGEHKSIDQLLDIFGLGDIHFKEALPPEISDALFKELALKEVTISIKNKEITSFSVDVGATHKLNLIEDKLSFLPSFFISIYKFGGDPSVNFSASGELDIGGTLYDIYANPIFGEISFGLRKGSTLNLKALGEKFFNTTALPELVFDNLHASVNYYTNKYKFELQAVDLLEFEVVSKKISIKSLALQVWYEMSSYAVTVSGKFDVCGFAFDLGGTYYGNNEYSFSACIANNIDINVSALLKDYLGCDCLLGDSFNFKIDQIVFCYHKRDKLSFDFGVRAEFCGSDQMLKKLFAVTADVKVTAGKETSGWGYKVQIACELLMGETQRLTCSYDYDSIGANRNEIKISYSPKTEGDAITVKDILKAIGMDEIDESWNFITEIGVTGATLNYDFVKKELSGNIKVTGGGSLEYSVQFGDHTKYSLKLSSTAVLKLSDVPIAGGLTDRYLSNGKDFTVKNLTVYALSEKDTQRNIPAGVRLELSVLGEQKSWQIYERSEAGQAQLAAAGTGPKVIWIKLDKTLAIFTLHRLGLGLDGSYLTLGLDASLNVSPLTFSLYGAGIGFNLSSHDLKYSLSGLGASFKSNVLTIDGAFRKDGGKYAGKLLIKVKPISIFAVAEYSETGSLFAYAVVSGRIGGLPEFFVTGLALGFGYNKQIRIPSIEKVADYPLIQGAKGDIVQDEILTRLDEVMKEENGQKFLAAGVKFSTYEIVDSFVLLLISFGNHFEIDILGISGVTMPPQCPEGISPIAHAQLALKASFKPADGFFGIEGRLTSESFILAKECHLKGGFAFYMWFGGEQSGDFVLTFGGYHPKYYATKPAHYPDVPGIGFEWKVNDNVNFCGEMYFALTPSAIMAGARLKATCDWGNFKAWFVAKADFIIAWKPFHYELEMGVIMGASYHVNTWLASFSVSVEIGTNLHIWGPDFSGTAYVDLGIVSFDVSFGAAAHKKPESLSWSAFCESFLPKAQAPTASLQNPAGSENKAAPLTISFGDGVNGEVTVGGKKIKSVQSGGLAMTVNSAVPIKTANVNRSGVSFTPVDVDVKPMGDNGRGLDSELLIIISGMQFEAEVVTKNMPTALWGGEGELRRNVPCGVLLKAQGKHDHEFIFPAVNVISLEDLYNKGTILINHAFVFLKPTTFPSYIGTGTVSVFSATVNTPSVATARETYLKSLGVILNKKIELTKYAAEAESYLDEEVLIPIS